MALVGGGGAGNTAGSNPSGTGTSLNHIGDHVTASSGQLPGVNSYTTGLLFNTGSNYIVGEFQFDAATRISNTANGDRLVFKIFINDEAVSIVKLDGETMDMPATAQIPMLLAPFSKVEVQYHGTVNDVDYPTFLRFTGRVYA